MLERDLADVSRALEEQKAKQIRYRPGSSSDLDSENKALVSAKVEIQAKLSKHKATPH
jgi:hypothetical protein